MDYGVNVIHEIIGLLYRRKSLESRYRQRVLRLDNKSSIHKRKKLIYWSLSKLKPFALQNLTGRG